MIMRYRSRKIETNHIQGEMEVKSKKEAEKIKQKIRKAVHGWNRLSKDKISYEVRIKINES